MHTSSPCPLPLPRCLLGPGWALPFLIGWRYALRGGHRRNSLTAGFVTFWVTATTYFPATALGLLLLAHAPIRWAPVWPLADLPPPLSPVRALAAAVEQALQSGLERLAGRPAPEGGDRERPVPLRFLPDRLGVTGAGPGDAAACFAIRWR
jgi:hypothetical protein